LKSHGSELPAYGGETGAVSKFTVSDAIFTTFTCLAMGDCRLKQENTAEAARFPLPDVSLSAKTRFFHQKAGDYGTSCNIPVSPSFWM